MNHIIAGHPEITGQLHRIQETIENPEIIQEGDHGELLAIRKYGKTPVYYDKFLVAVYKEVSAADGFLITAYYTRKPSARRSIIWKH